MLDLADFLVHAEPHPVGLDGPVGVLGRGLDGVGVRGQVQHAQGFGLGWLHLHVGDCIGLSVSRATSRACVFSFVRRRSSSRSQARSSLRCALASEAALVLIVLFVSAILPARSAAFFRRGGGLLLAFGRGRRGATGGVALGAGGVFALLAGCGGCVGGRLLAFAWSFWSLAAFASRRAISVRSWSLPVMCPPEVDGGATGRRDAGAGSSKWGDGGLGSSSFEHVEGVQSGGSPGRVGAAKEEDEAKSEGQFG